MAAPITIILIPGLISTARLFEAQIPAFGSFGRVTVADNTQDDTIEAMAHRILRTAPQRFVTAGLSMGGYVALEIVHQAPERVAGLALLGSSARPDTADQRKARLSQISYAESGLFGELPDMIFPFIVHPDREDDEDLRAVVRQMAIETGAEVFIQQQRAILARPDFRSGLAEIRCPTLVLVGEQDILAPPERSAEIAQGVDRSRFVTIPNCGHLSALERPPEVNAALTGWLATAAVA
ncbi:MAG: alpha/beta fold hydrolase [Aliidongia sp.]